MAIFCTGPDVASTAARLQLALNDVFQYLLPVGLAMNYQKTVAMMFTSKKITAPPLNSNGSLIGLVSDFKFLGVTLNGPVLDWKDSLTRLNVLRAVSSYHWGADRTLLLQMYQALVLSKINSGVEFYSSACTTLLKTLGSIQNPALRLIVGASVTSPVCSLEIEANVPP